MSGPVPRGDCRVCKRSVGIRLDGTLRGHNDKPLNGDPCPGWLHPPLEPSGGRRAHHELDITPLLVPAGAGKKRVIRELVAMIEQAHHGSTTVLVDRTGKRLAMIGPST